MDEKPEVLLSELFHDFEKYVKDYYPCYEGDEGYYNEVGLEKIGEWKERIQKYLKTDNKK